MKERGGTVMRRQTAEAAAAVRATAAAAAAATVRATAAQQRSRGGIHQIVAALSLIWIFRISGMSGHFDFVQCCQEVHYVSHKLVIKSCVVDGFQ